MPAMSKEQPQPRPAFARGIGENERRYCVARAWLHEEELISVKSAKYQNASCPCRLQERRFPSRQPALTQAQGLLQHTRQFTGALAQQLRRAFDAFVFAHRIAHQRKSFLKRTFNLRVAA